MADENMQAADEDVAGNRDAEAHSSATMVQLVTQGLVQMQESMRREMQETLHQHEQTMLERMTENNATIRCLEERMQRIEESVGMLENLMPSSMRQETVLDAGQQGPLHSLENRMRNLEVTMKKMIDNIYPRVELLVTHLENTSSSVRVSTLTCSSTSATTATSTAVSTSVSTSASTATSTITSTTDRTSSVTSSNPCSSTSVVVHPYVVSALPIVRNTPPSNNTPWVLDAKGRDLLDAIQEGRLADIYRLLDSGANANFSRADGWTPLMSAARYNRVNVARLLLERGADIHARNFYGNTVLHYAVCEDLEGECVSVFINAGSDVNARGDSGCTPLHIAVQWDRAGAVRELLAAGASRNAVDNFGRTPLEVAWSDPVRDLLNDQEDC